MNGRRLTYDIAHLRDHRYDPSGLATETTWTAQTVDAWLAADDDGVAAGMSQLLTQDGVGSITEVLKGGKLTQTHSPPSCTRGAEAG